MGERKDGQKYRRWRGAHPVCAVCVCALLGVAVFKMPVILAPLSVSATSDKSTSVSGESTAATDKSTSVSGESTAATDKSTSASGKNTATSESIKEKEDQINKMEKEKEALQSGLTNLQNLKKNLENEKADLARYITQLDGNLAEIEKNIANLKNQISDKEQEIFDTEEELAAAREIEKNQKELMSWHIRLMYEKGDAYLLEAILSADSFSELLNRADFMEQVAVYEQMLLEEYRMNTRYIALCVDQLELEREVLDEARIAVEAEQSSLESLIQQKTKDIVSYESDINNKETAIREYEQMIAQQDEEIKALEAAVAEERRQILENNGSVLTYDNGVFKFPLASYTRISDEYGMRMHPTLGVEQFHNGVDFAAPKGTAIYAAYDGKVVAATYSSSMGNYVMIDHGSNLYTIYMHASALYVTKGDMVVRGDTIAAVGTTGRSTGNHLHFGVRLNGEYVSPWNYLSQ